MGRPVVLSSLFEEQQRRDAAASARLVDASTESFAESLSYFPAAEDEAGAHRYLSCSNAPPMRPTWR